MQLILRMCLTALPCSNRSRDLYIEYLLTPVCLLSRILKYYNKKSLCVFKPMAYVKFDNIFKENVSRKYFIKFSNNNITK